MKKLKLILCMLIYCAVFVFTITAQWILIENSSLRTALNLSAIILTSFSVKAIIMLYKNRTCNENDSIENPGKDCGISVSKEEFLEYAANHNLSKRETEVAWLVQNGLSNQQIADEMYVSLVTIKKHVTHIYEKCNVSCRKKFKESIQAFIRNKN